MSIVSRIAAIRRRRNLGEDEKRRLIYAVKVTALIEAAREVLGLDVEANGFTFRINRAEATPQPALFLDVTFTRPPAAPVTHQITIVNPPVLPRAPTGNERNDLRTALRAMLEGFG